MADQSIRNGFTLQITITSAFLTAMIAVLAWIFGYWGNLNDQKIIIIALLVNLLICFIHLISIKIYAVVFIYVGYKTKLKENFEALFADPNLAVPSAMPLFQKNKELIYWVARILMVLPYLVSSCSMAIAFYKIVMTQGVLLGWWITCWVVSFAILVGTIVSGRKLLNTINCSLMPATITPNDQNNNP